MVQAGSIWLSPGSKLEQANEGMPVSGVTTQMRPWSRQPGLCVSFTLQSPLLSLHDLNMAEDTLEYLVYLIYMYTFCMYYYGMFFNYQSILYILSRITQSSFNNFEKG